MIEIIQKAIKPMSSPAPMPTDERAAAVLIPLVFNSQSEEWDVIFTRRAEHLKHHPGQISFPGGGFEVRDSDLSQTALRETDEEIGIQPEKIELLGHLSQQKTISLYNVTPFVGTVEIDSKLISELTIDHNEVAEVFALPLNFLIASKNQSTKHQTQNGINYSYPVIHCQSYTIWGTTAKILVDLTKHLQLN